MGARLVAQAGGIDYAGWAEVVRAASPIVGALIALIGVIASLRQNGRRDDARMEHDRELKKMELEAAREDRLRDERRLAYAHLIAAASTIKMEEAQMVEGIVKVSESTAETQLVAGSEKVKEGALKLYRQHENTLEMGVSLRIAGKNLDEDTDFQDSRDALRNAMFAFLEAAREDLGIESRTTGPTTSTDSEADPNM